MKHPITALLLLSLACNGPPQTTTVDGAPADHAVPADGSLDTVLTPDFYVAADSAADTTTPTDGTIGDATQIDVANADGTSYTDGASDSGPVDVLLADTSCPASIANCPGAPLPTWSLEDFQPKSSDFGKTYGLSAFNGKMLIVALLAGG